LNDDLTQDTPGVGYLTGDSEGIPEITEGSITEEFGYACRFWMDHVVEVEAPVSSEFLGSLRRFVSGRLILWEEITTLKYKFQKLEEVRKWIKRTLPQDDELINDTLNPSIGEALVSVSKRLSYMDRRGEALAAIQEAVDLHRRLAADRPAAFNPDLALSLNNLSARLSDMGHREEALLVTEEAATLRR